MNDPYFEKYMKYKRKYIELKEQTGGLITLKSGVYTYFIFDEKAYDALNFKANTETSLSNSNINEKLNKKAYRIKNGQKKLELVTLSGVPKVANFSPSISSIIPNNSTLRAYENTSFLSELNPFKGGNILPETITLTSGYTSTENNNIVQKIIDSLNNPKIGKIHIVQIQINITGSNKFISHEIYPSEEPKKDS